MRKSFSLLALALSFALSCREKEKSVAAPPPTPSPVPSLRPEPVLGYIDESREGPPVEGGVLRRRLLGEPSTLNAVLQSGLPEQQVLQYLSRNLLDFDSRMNLVPGLALRYEVSPDGREFRFTLRPDAVWEDGAPVSARDAVFTLKKIVDPKVPAPVFKSLFEDLLSVEATGERAFVARFKRPYAYRAMSFVLPLLPERRFAAKSFARAKENRSPLSNGPYRLQSWKPQQSIELVRNDRYWGARGRFERIVFRILPETSVSYRALLSGELDETALDEAWKQRAARDPEFQRCCRLVEFYNLDYNYIALNNRLPFFADPRVRQALTMLLDRATIVRGLYRGSARIISGPWAPDSPAYDSTVAPLPFDPAAAARLLDAAGWRDSNGNGTRDSAGREFEFELLVSAGSEIGRQIDELFAAELARVGISAHVRSLEWASFAERVDAGDFEAASLAWSASDPNPDPYPYWHSSQWPPRGLNSGFFGNAEADRMMEEARAETEDGLRLRTYHRLHALLRDQSPAIFVTNASAKHAFRRRVHGLVTSPLGLWSIWPGPLGWWASAAVSEGTPP